MDKVPPVAGGIVRVGRYGNEWTVSMLGRRVKLKSIYTESGSQVVSALGTGEVSSSAGSSSASLNRTCRRGLRSGGGIGSSGEEVAEHSVEVRDQ
jgi:hypothetical protein